MSLKNPKKCGNCGVIIGIEKKVTIFCNDCTKKLNLEQKHDLAECMCKNCSEKIESIIQNKKNIQWF